MLRPNARHRGDDANGNGSSNYYYGGGGAGAPSGGAAPPAQPAYGGYAGGGYSTSPTPPYASGGAQQQYGGYQGQADYNYSHGNGASAAVGSTTEVFKDKPRRNRRGSFVIPAAAKNPATWIFLFVMAAFGTLVWSYTHKTKQAHKLTKEELLNIKREKETLQRQMEYVQQSNNKKLSSLEEQKKQLSDELQQHKEEKILSKAKKDDDGADGDRKKGEANAAILEAYRDMLYQMQNATQRQSQRAVLEKYGEGPHQVQFTVVLPSDESETPLTFTMELAPVEVMPHATHIFLEQVSNKLWDDSWFYVNGPHVLQAGPQASDEEVDAEEAALAAAAGDAADVDVSNLVDEREIALRPFKDKNLESLVFPEYSSAYPHEQWTVGFTGRPGGPDWYINKQNNTIGHGPGGQGHHELDEYADPCFAKVIEGFEVLEKVIAEETFMEGDLQFFFDEPVYILTARIVGYDPESSIAKEEKTQAKQTESVEGSSPADLEKPPESDVSGEVKAETDGAQQDAASEQKPAEVELSAEANAVDSDKGERAKKGSKGGEGTLQKSKKAPSSKGREGAWRGKRGETKTEKKTHKRRLMMARFDHQVEP